MKTPILLLDNTAQKFILEHIQFIVISYRLAGGSATVWRLYIELRAKNDDCCRHKSNSRNSHIEIR
jgi:hypothetical protein